MFEGEGGTIVVCGTANLCTSILLEQGYNVVLHSGFEKIQQITAIKD